MSIGCEDDFFKKRFADPAAVERHPAGGRVYGRLSGLSVWWKSMTAESEPKLRVLFDLNVVLDVLARRQPHYADAARLWAYVESGQIEGLLAAHSVTMLFYVLRRHLGLPQAKSALHDVLQVFRVAAVDQAVIKAALILGWNDFEDAVQATAVAQPTPHDISGQTRKLWDEHPHPKPHIVVGVVGGVPVTVADVVTVVVPRPAPQGPRPVPTNRAIWARISPLDCASRPRDCRFRSLARRHTGIVQR